MSDKRKEFLEEETYKLCGDCYECKQPIKKDGVYFSDFERNWNDFFHNQCLTEYRKKQILMTIKRPWIRN